MAVTAEQLKANLRTAESLARRRAGLPPESEAPDSSLTYEQRVKLIKEMATIVRQYPDRFNETLAKTAAMVERTRYEPLSSLSAGEAISIFSGEFAAQLDDINKAVNPFAAENRQAAAANLKWLAFIIVLGGAAVYLGPSLFSAGKSLRDRTQRRAKLA